MGSARLARRAGRRRRGRHAVPHRRSLVRPHPRRERRGRGGARRPALGRRDAHRHARPAHVRRRARTAERPARVPLGTRDRGGPDVPRRPRGAAAAHGRGRRALRPPAPHAVGTAGLPAAGSGRAVAEDRGHAALRRGDRAAPVRRAPGARAHLGRRRRPRDGGPHLRARLLARRPSRRDRAGRERPQRDPRPGRRAARPRLRERRRHAPPTSPSSAAGPPDSRRRSTGHPRAFARCCSIRSPRAGSPRRRRGSRTTSDSRSA